MSIERGVGVTRVLVADDDDLVRTVLVRGLGRAGFEVVAAASAQAALAAMTDGVFDVVLSDVRMPGGSGLDLLKAIRRVDLDVPVILMTGAPNVESAAAAVEYGAFRYLTKPFEEGALVELLRLAARAHELARVRREAFALGGSPAGAADRAGLEVRFEQALAQVWMAFQPIVEPGGRAFGVEALLRSHEASMPTPMHVLDAATALGRVAEVGRRVRALSAEASVAAAARDLALFVNLHPTDLLDPELVADTSPLTAIAPRVVLEITERASLASTPALLARVTRLRELGFRIAIDDIGAGYSGLTTFTSLMPEIVKLDMALVRDVDTSAVKQRTIGAVCGLCHDLGARVVGEGVETLAERDCLLALGCDYLQGYAFGRPAPTFPRR